MKRVEAQYQWNHYRTFAVIFSLMVLGLGIASLVSPSWVTNEVRLVTPNPNESEFSYGPFRTCYEIHSFNFTTLNSTFDDECRGYGTDINEDFPHVAWFVTAFFMASTCAMQVLILILAAMSKCLHTDRVAFTGGMFSTIFFIVTIFVFPLGFGSTFTNENQLIGYETNVQVCEDGASYDIGGCQLSWGYITAVAATILSFAVPICLLLSEKSDKRTSTRQTYKTTGYM